MEWLRNPAILSSGLLLALYQFLAAIPWLAAVDPKGFRNALKNPSALAPIVIGVAGVGLALAAFLGYAGQSTSLTFYGKIYGSILHLQLIIDFFLLAPQLLILLLPKTGAVALAAFREGCRQPMFWLIASFAVLLMAISIVVPYFTFGDDYKMMKQIGYDICMLAALVFGVLAASMSISEEIEGRTAITLMSKPVNRRQFLLGKFFGILLACMTMTLLLGWFLNWALIINPAYDKINEVRDTLIDQGQSFTVPLAKKLTLGPAAQVFGSGVGMWFGDTWANTIGLVLGFGQVMILVSISAALATRLPFVVNIVVVLVVYFLGHLAPVVVKVTEKAQSDGEGSTASGLIRFFGGLFDTLMPALDSFNMSSAIVRDRPLDLDAFAGYVLSVFGYSIVYTSIAMLIGLLLFEDRDLA